MNRRHECKRSRYHLTDNPHPLQPDLQRQCSIVENTYVIYIEKIGQLARKTLKNRTVVSQPLAVLYIPQILVELFNGREKRSIVTPSQMNV